MNRRLNPEIFGPQPASADDREPQYSAVAARKMETEIKETRRQISHLESLIEVVQSQMTSLAHNNESRIEAFSRALSSLEKDFREHQLEQSRRAQYTQDRFRDQKIKDNQMENMVDRFNTNLIQFENKISTLQKVISEKEMTLMTYRRIMEQIVDEVEKLKQRSSMMGSNSLF